MARFWTSIADAAEWLGVEQQDIVKQADDAKLPSRTLDDGTREVQIDIAGPKGQANFTQALEVIDQTTKRELQAAGVAIGQARNLAGHMENSLRIARIGNYVAWGLLVALLIGAAIVNHVFNKAIADKDSQIGVLTERLADAKKQIAEQESKIASLTKRGEDLFGDRERNAAQLAAVQTEKRALSQKLDTVQKDRDDLDVDYKTAKKSLDDAEARNKLLMDENINLRLKLAAATASQPASAPAPARP